MRSSTSSQVSRGNAVVIQAPPPARCRPRPQLVLQLEFDDAAGFRSSYLSDLSGGGIRITTSMQVGQRFFLRISAAGCRHPLQIEAVVQWSLPEAGRTLGLLGVGEIGSRVAKLASAFGMTVQGLAHRPGEQVRHGVPLVALATLLETSDVVSLHLRLSAETRRIMNAEAFARMRHGSFLVNTARGELVDEEALAGALARGQLAGAALDTLQHEPPAPDHPLLGRPEVLLTPHTAWLTRESWRRTLAFGFANVERFRAGQPLRSLVRPTHAIVEP